MKKSLLTIATVTVVSFGSVFFSAPVAAESIDDLKDKQTELKEERKSLKANLSDAEAEIADILIELEEIEVELERITHAIEENKKAMEENKLAIEATEVEIAALEEEIIALEEAIEARFEILKDRAIAYQQNGGNISFVEVLFGSQSFGDFISRVTAINKVTESDAALMEQIEADKVIVEEKQAEVKSKLEELESLKTELEGMQALIEDQEKEAKNKQKEVKKQEEVLRDKVKEIKLEDDKLSSLEKKVKRNITALLTPPAPPSAAPSNGNLSTLGKSSSTGGGYFAWPAVGGYISSYMGPRWGRNHNGIDIARPSNYNILAADGGTVTKTSYHSGLGNHIEIQHSNGIKTLYAHLSSIQVQAGQKVSRGQVIGIMGTTGNSTGIHLHLEVRKNGALQNPMDYLN